MSLCNVYPVAKTFPKHEMFGSNCQMRQTAVSIPSNIANDTGETEFPVSPVFIKAI
ncbi:MAG: four helix bundle protein [Chloroflexota bacterium]